MDATTLSGQCSAEAPRSVADVLRAARAKIEQPEHWCRHFLAIDGDGKMVHWAWPEAEAWCSIGAVASVARTPDDDVLSVDAEEILEACLPDERGLPRYNDDPRTTHADILALFDRAIAKAEGRDS